MRSEVALLSLRDISLKTNITSMFPEANTTSQFVDQSANKTCPFVKLRDFTGSGGISNRHRGERERSFRKNA